MGIDQYEVLLLDMAEDRQRITALEDHIESLTKTIKQLEIGTVVTTKTANNTLSFEETKESKCQRLYCEIKKRGFLKSKHVMDFLKCTHYTQAYRIMEMVEQSHADITVMKSIGKGLKIITIKN